MNTEHVSIGAVLALVFSLALTGCEQAAQTADDDSAAKTASVTLGVSIWDQTGASKALIDDTRTASINLEWWTVEGPALGWTECLSYIRTRVGTATLTPDSPTHTVNLVPGNYCFGATAIDGQGAWGEQVWSGGTLLAGGNTVILNFLSGVWTFVDGLGNPEPIVLNTPSNNPGTYAGFSLAPFSIETAAAKTTLDLDKPVGSGSYFFVWNVNADMSTNKELSQLFVVSQFSGGSINDFSAVGGFYNVSKGCSDAVDYLTLVSCDSGVNETEMMLLGLDVVVFDNIDRLTQPFPLPLGTFSDDNVLQYFTTTVVDGETISGHLAEIFWKGETVDVVEVGLQAATGGSTAAASKAATLPDFPNLLITSYEYAVCGKDSNGDQSIDVGDWVFDATDEIKEIQGEWTCYEYGYLTTNVNPNFGEYSWGIEQTGTATGECFYDPRIYGPEPWVCSDQNDDGTIDVGDYELRHYIRSIETADVWVHPFIAKGAPLPAGFVPPVIGY